MRTENPLQQQVEKNIRDLVMISSLTDIWREKNVEEVLIKMVKPIIQKALNQTPSRYIGYEFVGTKNIYGDDEKSKGKSLIFDVYVETIDKQDAAPGLLSATILNNDDNLYLHLIKDLGNGKLGIASSEAIDGSNNRFDEMIISEVKRLYGFEDNNFRTEKNIKGPNFG